MHEVVSISTDANRIVCPRCSARPNFGRSNRRAQVGPTPLRGTGGYSVRRGWALVGFQFVSKSFWRVRHHRAILGPAKPVMATRTSRRAEGSGTDDGLPLPSELLGDRDASSEPPPLFMPTKPIPPAPNGPLGASEPPNANPPNWPNGLPEASLAAIVTRPALPAVPPMTSVP